MFYEKPVPTFRHHALNGPTYESICGDRVHCGDVGPGGLSVNRSGGRNREDTVSPPFTSAIFAPRLRATFATTIEEG
jgi:hypothetical protein